MSSGWIVALDAYEGLYYFCLLYGFCIPWETPYYQECCYCSTRVIVYYYIYLYHAGNVALLYVITYFVCRPLFYFSDETRWFHPFSANTA